MSVQSKSRQMLNKVPEITILFWIIKVLATTVGETAADFFEHKPELGLDHYDIYNERSLDYYIVLSVYIRSRYCSW